MRSLRFSFLIFLFLISFSSESFAQIAGVMDTNKYQTLMSGMQTGSGTTHVTGSGMLGGNSSDPHDQLEQIFKRIAAFVLFSQSREVCERQDSCDISIPQWQAEIILVEQQIATAKQNIANGEAQLANLRSGGNVATPGSPVYVNYMNISQILMQWREYLLKKQNRLADLKMNIDMCNQSIKVAKDSFIGLCASKFESSCSSALPGFMNPGREAIKAAAKSFCEGQLQTALAWQCPFERAKRPNDQRCKENYDRDVKACDNSPTPGFCVIGAASTYLSCLKNIPGYNGNPLPTPNEGEKLNNVTLAAIPACWAVRR